jgi:hypothetical protein
MALEVANERTLHLSQLIGIEIEGDHAPLQKARVVYTLLSVLLNIGI